MNVDLQKRAAKEKRRRIAEGEEAAARGRRTHMLEVQMSSYIGTIPFPLVDRDGCQIEVDWEQRIVWFRRLHWRWLRWSADPPNYVWVDSNYDEDTVKHEFAFITQWLDYLYDAILPEVSNEELDRLIGGKE